MTGTLADLAERLYDLTWRGSPFSATIFGAREYDALVPDVSEDGEAAHVAEAVAIADAAEAIDPTTLSGQDRITRSMLLWQTRIDVESIRSRSVEFAAAPFFVGPHAQVLQYVPKAALITPEHAEAYLERLSKLDGFLDQAVDRLRSGTRSGRTAVARAAEMSVRQLDGYLAAGPEADPLRVPAPPDGVDADGWRARRDALLEERVRPALGRVRDALRDEVLPAARSDEQCGVRWLADGAEIYAAAIRQHTTTDRGPEELHQLGLDVLASVDEEWRSLGEKVLGTADLAGILTRLRDDAGLRFGSPDEIVRSAEEAVARATAAVPGWFGRVPSTSCVVRPMSALEATSAPPAYYTPPAPDGSVPGTYWVNTHDGAGPTRFDSETIAFHESLPGHHLQLGVAQELTELPRFRRLGLVTAYAEGWGLYTERLADEMGLYSDDVSRLGMLSADSWRACRLVVDTGIHHFGWSRQQAIDFMTARTPIAPGVIANEVDRYIALTGQALSYMVGRVEIVDLRRGAEAALGAGFDIRAFHDVVLGNGAVPLAVLREIVERWITDQRQLS